MTGGAEPDRRRPTRAVFVISVAAELAGLHPQTLRVYERRGLLAPNRTGGGRRRYSEADIDRLRRIQELTDEGLNLAGVARVLALEDELARARAELLAEAERRRVELAQAVDQARHAVEQTVRHYRRELVPLSQAVELFGRPRFPTRP